ncbi:MAG: ERAP1-like C-terminal domain-containing protein, partial [Gammaproteobacteria bacterium]
PTTHCPAWIMPNANGAGYYRFAFDAAGWEAAFAHLDALDRDEARVLFAALSSAFRAGTVDADTMIEGFARAAAHPDWQVATAQLGNLISMRDWLAATPAARAGVEARIRALYGEPLSALGLDPRPDDTVETARHRVALARAVALFGNDPGIRARLADDAGRYLLYAAGESDVQPRIDPDLLASALRVAVEDRGTEIWDPALELLALSEDPLFRSRVVGALGYARDPALTPRLLQLLSDPRLRDNEATELAYALADNAFQQDAIWRWIQVPEHREQLLARIPAWRKGGIVGLGARACDAERAAALAAWFGPLADDLEGGPRALAQARESIELCVALVGRHGPDVTRIFSQ